MGGGAMNLRSAADIIAVAESRGFKVLVREGPPPMPYLLGDRSQATPALMDALRTWRLDIIEEIKNRQTCCHSGAAN